MGLRGIRLRSVDSYREEGVVLVAQLAEGCNQAVQDQRKGTDSGSGRGGGEGILSVHCSWRLIASEGVRIDWDPFLDAAVAAEGTIEIAGRSLAGRAAEERKIVAVEERERSLVAV